MAEEETRKTCRIPLSRGTLFMELEIPQLCGAGSATANHLFQKTADNLMLWWQNNAEHALSLLASPADGGFYRFCARNTVAALGEDLTRVVWQWEISHRGRKLGGDSLTLCWNARRRRWESVGL